MREVFSCVWGRSVLCAAQPGFPSPQMLSLPRAHCGQGVVQLPGPFAFTVLEKPRPSALRSHVERGRIGGQ